MKIIDGHKLTEVSDCEEMRLIENLFKLGVPVYALSNTWLLRSEEADPPIPINIWVWSRVDNTDYLKLPGVTYSINVDPKTRRLRDE